MNYLEVLAFHCNILIKSMAQPQFVESVTDLSSSLPLSLTHCLATSAFQNPVFNSFVFFLSLVRHQFVFVEKTLDKYRQSALVRTCANKP